MKMEISFGFLYVKSVSFVKSKERSGKSTVVKLMSTVIDSSHCLNSSTICFRFLST